MADLDVIVPIFRTPGDVYAHPDVMGIEDLVAATHAEVVQPVGILEQRDLVGNVRIVNTKHMLPDSSKYCWLCQAR
jgi:hypothetical protein